jgi:signal transduction histidine kinase
MTIDTNALQSTPSITADVQKMKTALSIILENAVKYGKESSTVSVSLSVHTTADQREFLKLTITDEGIGLHPEDAAHLFEKFYRGKNARNAVPNGMGLGLYIAKTILELHNGKIWAQQDGAKTVFSIELPYTE